jgi:hypothetical protein
MDRVTTWTVAIRVAWDPSSLPRKAFEESVRRLSAQLRSRCTSTETLPYVLVVRFNTAQEDSTAAAIEALSLLRNVAQEADLPPWMHLDLDADPESSELPNADMPGSDRRSPRTPPPPIAGVTEAAGLLGISKQRLAQLSDRPDFPTPWRLAAGPFWLRSDLEAFHQRRPRRRGRLGGPDQKPSTEKKNGRSHNGKTSHGNLEALIRNGDRDLAYEAARALAEYGDQVALASKAAHRLAQDSRDPDALRDAARALADVSNSPVTLAHEALHKLTRTAGDPHALDNVTHERTNLEHSA